MRVTYIDHMGSDLSVVNSARVSFGKHREEMNASDERLIAYLAEHNHTSPFGHCFASFHIAAPIFVARQLVKHKFLRWNEISRRYVDYEPTLHVPESWRGRAESKKQGSEGVVDTPISPSELYDEAIKHYQLLLSSGVCPEQARMVLPQSLMTEWYWSGSLDAFADMCNLRCADDSQRETKEVADGVDETMSFLFPISWKELRSDRN